MFLLDDILLSPVKAIMAIGRQVQEAAQKELEDQEKVILRDLAELHQTLEAGAITDEDFNARETVLLDRLDAIQGILEPPDDDDHGR